MTSFFKKLSVVGAVLLVVGAVSFALAQAPRGGRRGPPMYTVQAETTIKGTVEKVETIAGPDVRGRRALGGTHLMVRTETQVLEVHLGPTAYLAEQGVTVKEGDAVEIVGSRVTIDEKPVLLARQLRKGEFTWDLRDASGRPLWSGRLR